jgi:hypothetical protein
LSPIGCGRPRNGPPSPACSAERRQEVDFAKYL